MRKLVAFLTAALAALGISATASASPSRSGDVLNTHQAIHATPLYPPIGGRH